METVTVGADASGEWLDDPALAAAADSKLIAAINQGLVAIAESPRARQMQAYMKSEMPYLGARVPEVRAVTRTAARAIPPVSVAGLRATAGVLWRDATYREQRYAATELTGLPMAAGALTLLPLYQHMIVSGAWWDHVDAVSGRLGRLLIQHPEQVQPVLLSWSTNPDRWLRRASIIAQLRAKTCTDLVLLTKAIDANAADRDFFVSKAIGWALRNYARTDPEWVREFVAARADVLSSLARREATKHLN